MKTHAQYITDEKGRKKAVVLDIKEYEKILRALEDLEDKKAFVSVAREKSVPYGEIETSVMYTLLAKPTVPVPPQ